MYLRIIRCHMREGVDACRAADVYHEILPAVLAYDGCLGASFMINDSSHEAVAFIYWDTMEHAAQAGEVLRPMLFDQTWELTDSALDITGYQVLHHLMPGS